MLGVNAVFQTVLEGMLRPAVAGLSPPRRTRLVDPSRQSAPASLPPRLLRQQRARRFHPACYSPIPATRERAPAAAGTSEIQLPARGRGSPDGLLPSVLTLYPEQCGKRGCDRRRIRYAARCRWKCEISLSDPPRDSVQRIGDCPSG